MPEHEVAHEGLTRERYSKCDHERLLPLLPSGRHRAATTLVGVWGEESRSRCRSNALISYPLRGRLLSWLLRFSINIRDLLSCRGKRNPAVDRAEVMEVALGKGRFFWVFLHLTIPGRLRRRRACNRGGGISDLLFRPKNAAKLSAQAESADNPVNPCHAAGRLLDPHAEYRHPGLYAHDARRHQDQLQFLGLSGLGA